MERFTDESAAQRRGTRDPAVSAWTWRAFRATAALVVVFAVSASGLLGHGALHDAIGSWGNAVVGLACAAICVLRWRRSARARGAWLLIGAGISAWAIGNAWFSLAYGPDASAIPTPSIADGFWLAFYPLLFAGVMLLARRRFHELGVGLWLDGLIVALAGAALLGTFVLPPIVARGGGLSLALLVNVAYPLGDLVLCVLVLGVILSGTVRACRGALASALAPIAFAISDSVYIVQSDNGSYAVGGPLDSGWQIGLLLAAYVSIVWALPHARTRDRRADVSLAVPIVAGLAALAVLVVEARAHVGTIGVAAAAAAVLLVIVRMGLTTLENRRVLAQLRRASTDALTGLANRRQLFVDLAQLDATAAHPVAVVVFDLDGFKTYNDMFGHAAGDQVLRRLAATLSEALAGHGCAYRLGGDEFCTILDPAPASPEQLCHALAQRLAQRGRGFAITASFGLALAPRDGEEPGELLRRADRRLYEAKHARRPSAATQAVDALLATVQERHPTLSHHVDGVATLAHELGERLGLADEELDAVAHAAALHDVGKVAIPDEILHKPGPLDSLEWAFMRRHTIIGERILLPVPALRSAAPLVRWSHERWDGSGYPDGLRGDRLPLGASIVAACDAFDAMTEDRPYQAAITPREALAELRRQAGAQFDPRVVEALCALIEEHLAQARHEHRAVARRPMAPSPA